MKLPIYLRIAKTSGRKGYKVQAGSEPNNQMLCTKDYRGEICHPTVAFRVDINVPDECFEQAERLVAEINVALKEANVSGEIVLPTGVTVKKKK